MPDPQVLYAVTAVVLVGLVVWAFVVLTRSPDEDAAPPAALRKDGALPAVAGAAAALAAPAPELAEASAAASAVDKPSARPTPLAQPAADAPDEFEVSVDTEEGDDDDVTGPQALILVTATGRTDPGLKRKHNEDAYVILEEHHIFVIADGMGRHAAGEIASQLCVDAIAEAYKNNDFSRAPKEKVHPRRARELCGAIQLANERILKQAQDVDEYHGMGTTVVAASFSQNNQRVYIAHVGDSRCYRVRDGKLKQLTKDHTLGAAGIQGKSSNVLSRAVGIEAGVEIDVSMESPLPGDTYLLCSDGLSRMATDDEILETLTKHRDLDAAVKELIDLANSRGGRDNITTILVRVDKPQSPASRPNQSAG